VGQSWQSRESKADGQETTRDGEGTTPPVTAQDGLHVVACIEAAFKALRGRREVAVG